MCLGGNRNARFPVITNLSVSGRQARLLPAGQRFQPGTSLSLNAQRLKISAVSIRRITRC